MKHLTKLILTIALGIWLMPNTDKQVTAHAPELPYLESPIIPPVEAEEKNLYEAASEAYGAPASLLEAIHQVESGKSGNDRCPVSYAGAKGQMQFLPSTWNRYGVDGNGDGIANICDVEDSVFSASHYLSANHALSNSWDQAIWQYNHSQKYVAQVQAIQEEIEAK